MHTQSSRTLAPESALKLKKKSFYSDGIYKMGLFRWALHMYICASPSHFFEISKKLFK